MVAAFHRVAADSRLLLSGLLSIAALSPMTRFTAVFVGFWVAGILSYRFKRSPRRWIWAVWNYAFIGVLSTVAVQSFLLGEDLKGAGFAWITVQVFRQNAQESIAANQLNRLKEKCRNLPI